MKAKELWLAALAGSDAFARARPPEELGCLYYSRGEERFVVPPAEGTLPEGVAVHFRESGRGGSASRGWPRTI